MIRSGLLVMLLALATGCASENKDERPVPSQPFEVGQAWSYRARPGEEDSVLLIGRIEQATGGTVVHVQVQGVSIHGPEQEAKVIGHLPISENALRSSVIALSQGELDEILFEQGYEMWASAPGGVFTIPVRDLVDSLARLFGSE